MDLLVSVEEGRTGQLQFGLGYGSYGGLMLNGSVSERNLFGTGQSMSLYANIATGGVDLIRACQEERGVCLLGI